MYKMGKGDMAFIKKKVTNKSTRPVSQAIKG